MSEAHRERWASLGFDVAPWVVPGVPNFKAEEAFDTAVAAYVTARLEECTRPVVTLQSEYSRQWRVELNELFCVLDAQDALPGGISIQPFAQRLRRAGLLTRYSKRRVDGKVVHVTWVLGLRRRVSADGG